MRLSTLDELDALRLRVTSLVDTYDSGDPAFADEVKKWLTVVEQTFAVRRVPSAGGIAALRATLIAAANGAVPEGVTFAGRTTPRKVRDAVSAGVLRKAEDLIADAARNPAAQFAEAERLIRQMTAVARRKGIFDSPESPPALWSKLEEDAELAAVAVHVVGLVGAGDAQILLDRVLHETA
jgi:hypothetical protein